MKFRTFKVFFCVTNKCYLLLLDILQFAQMWIWSVLSYPLKAFGLFLTLVFILFYLIFRHICLSSTRMLICIEIILLLLLLNYNTSWIMVSIWWHIKTKTFNKHMPYVNLISTTINNLKNYWNLWRLNSLTYIFFQKSIPWTATP